MIIICLVIYYSADMASDVILYCIVLLLRLPIQHKAGVNGGPNKKRAVACNHGPGVIMDIAYYTIHHVMRW